jgi:hypothetical protein
LPRWFLAAGTSTAIFLATFGLISCGGGSSSQSTQASSPSSPSSGTTVIDNVDDGTWLTCGACGNTGGTGPVANYSATVGIASPSEDGSATQFAISATVPFTNAYFYQVHNSIPAQINSLVYEFDLYIPSGMENAPQAIEFECQQKLDGWIYNFSWQANYATNVWRIFNYGAKQWETSGLALQRFMPGTWHHIAAEYHSDASGHSVFHDALTIDGVRNPVNIRHDAFLSGGNDQFTNALQLDSNSHPDAYSVYVDQMKITYK